MTINWVVKPWVVLDLEAIGLKIYWVFKVVNLKSNYIFNDSCDFLSVLGNMKYIIVSTSNYNYSNI